MACFLLLAWLGNYFWVSGFGIYEDDYFFTTGVYGWNWNDAYAHVKHALLTWPQFRPLGFALTYLVTYATAQFDSLLPAYAVGLILQSVNAWLIYLIALRKVRTEFAIFAGAVFLLYPADTGKMILMLRVFQLLNLTFVLSALLLYVHGWRKVSYAVAALCLLTYEHFYLPFLLAPFIAFSMRPLPLRRLMTHAIAFAIPPLLLIVSRKFLGDVRAADVISDPVDAIEKAAAAMVIGPRTAVASLGLRSWDAIWHSDATQWTAIALATTAALGAMIVAAKRASCASSATPRIADLTLTAAGLIVCFCAGYVLAIRPDNFPPVTNLGRLSGFNAPASVSCVLLLGCLLELAANASSGFTRIVRLPLALWVGLLVSFGLEVQKWDYGRHWAQQREIWNVLLADSGEWRRNTPVIVDMDQPGDADAFTAGFPFFWIAVNTPWGAENFVDRREFSRRQTQVGDATLPRVYGYSRTFGGTLQENGYQLSTPPQAPELRPLINSGEFFLYRFVNGHLVRTSAPLSCGEHTYTPIPPPASSPAPLAFSRLYLILSATRHVRPAPHDIPWPSYATGRNYPH